MKVVYEEKVKKMIRHYEDMRKLFKWENDMVRHLVALTYAMKSEELDSASIKDMNDYIKKETGLFSPFLTSGDDYALAILLAGTDHSPDLLENYYQALNG